MKYINYFSLSFLLVFGLFSCDDSNEGTKGRLNLALTDAPLYDENITGVFIRVIGIEIKGNDGWTGMESFDTPVSINLLDYQNGDVYFLTEEELNAGDYKEIRLLLDMPEENGAPKSNPGTYLQYEDGSTQPLYVPSGATSGYKAKGDFSIPAGGVTSLTIDFNVRKSVVKAGNSGKYILKPVLRLVENNNVALIEGEVTTLAEYESVRVYAYEDDTFTESEIIDPETDEVDFPNAVTSGSVNEDGTYKLAFMEPGTYDLYAVAFDENGDFISIIAEWQDVTLQAGTIEVVNLEEID